MHMIDNLTQSQTFFILALEQKYYKTMYLFSAEFIDTLILFLYLVH
jgi:hypothetical protein